MKPFIAIVAVAVAVRMYYSSAVSPSITFTPDSYEYYGLANNIASQPSVKLIFNPYRTAIYPLIILASMTTQILAVVQSFVAIAALLFFYATLRAFVTSGRVAFISSLLIASDILLLAWERTLLAESFAISWMLVFVSVFIRSLGETRLSRLALLLLLAVIGIYLKPAFVVVPAVAGIILLMRQKSNIRVFRCLAWLVLYAAVPLTHTQLNRVNWGYHGFQVVSEFNLLGRILDQQLPVATAGQTPYFSDRITSYRAQHGNPNPYRFLDWVDPAIYVDVPRLHELARFNRAVIRSQLGPYILGTIANIPKAFADISPFIWPPPQWGAIFRLLHLLTMGTVIILPLSAYHIVRAPGQKRPIASAVGILGWSLILTNALFGYEDFARLGSPAMPLLIFSAVYWAGYSTRYILTCALAKTGVKNA